MAIVGEVRFRHRLYRKNLYNAYLDAMRESYARGDRRDDTEERFRRRLLREYQEAANRDRVLENAEVATVKQDARTVAIARRKHRDRQRYRERVSAMA